ncbi:hypothetical protein [Candidatus Parabeggiatoa sp. HSG14]|uniref:hypothetical protein n=1 Tax=Candidatus Parabeggiatoa sp. HSG14 TaxID=3055593 RepID=UPI0025A8CFA7|nr:hypothetical protein [Thiotrichales bacterium HSG14]
MSALNLMAVSLVAGNSCGGWWAVQLSVKRSENNSLDFIIVYFHHDSKIIERFLIDMVTSSRQYLIQGINVSSLNSVEKT